MATENIAVALRCEVDYICRGVIFSFGFGVAAEVAFRNDKCISVTDSQQYSAVCLSERVYVLIIKSLTLAKSNQEWFCEAVEGISTMPSNCLTLNFTNKCKSTIKSL